MEKAIIGVEIERGVLGNHKVRVSLRGTIIIGKTFYDYDIKYLINNTQSNKPADLSEEDLDKLHSYFIKAFKVLKGHGLSRVDFFVTTKNEIYINEINTFPGFTTTSMFPKLWDKTELQFKELIEILIQLAVENNLNIYDVITCL